VPIMCCCPYTVEYIQVFAWLVLKKYNSLLSKILVVDLKETHHEPVYVESMYFEYNVQTIGVDPKFREDLFLYF
jgi:hypothetical protein